MSQFKKITNLILKYASLVKNPANKKRFAVLKSSDRDEIKIIKSSRENWTVVKGVLYEPDTYDSQGHKMDAEELRKAAYQVMKNGGLKVDIEHKENIVECSVVELYIPETNEKLGNQIAKAGSIIVAVEIEDEEIRKAVDSGEITGFSMAGIGHLEDVEKSEIEGPFKPIIEFSEFLNKTFNDSSMTAIEKKEDIFFNLSNFEEQILKSTDEKLNIKKSNVGAKMPELTEEKISEMIAKGVVEGIAKHEKAKEENLTKSADAKKIEDLQKAVDGLKEKMLGSEAGKDGAEGIKKADDEESESWL